MNIEETRRRCRGIQLFAITPLLESGGDSTVDQEGMKRNIEFWVEAGIPAVVVCGGVGELWQLDPEEHLQVVRAAAEQSAGRVVVIAGVTGDTEACVATSRRVEEAGADAVLLFPAGSAGRDGRSLLDFYTEVSEAVEIGLMPFRIDDTVDLELVRRFAELPNMLALKEESERMDDFEHLVREVGDRVVIAGAGSDQLAPCFLIMGAGALTSSAANYAPHKLVEMWDAAQRGDFQEVVRIHAALRPLELIRQRHSHRLLKAAMDAIGLAGGATRAPGLPLDEASRAEMERQLRELGAVTSAPA